MAHSLYNEVTAVTGVGYPTNRVLGKLKTASLDLPYSLEDIKISHNDFAVTEVYNDSIRKLYRNYLYLIANAEMVTTTSPTSSLSYINVDDAFTVADTSGNVVTTGSLNVSDVINSAGDVVAYYTSDERLKSNIKTINKPIYKLKQLRGVEYEWNGLQNTYASGSKDSGIIAQDVQKVLPQLVKERDNGYLGVRHDRLVGLLVEAIKEQQEQIDELKTEVKELKNGSSF